MSARAYDEFLTSKSRTTLSVGIDVDDARLHPRLFPFQREIVLQMLALGRGAIFASTGLGKTSMQIEWARIVAETTTLPVLIFAPLAVASQTVREARVIGVDVTSCKEQSDVTAGVNITNYDRLDRFDCSILGGIVLEESSVLKATDGKTRTHLIEVAQSIRFRLACTATPAPNDVMELGNHADFLGVMKSAEMLATYFVHDGGETQKWRLKGHAEKAFWVWVSSWAMVVDSPSDLGYDGSAYVLPDLRMHEHVLDAPAVTDGDTLFALPASSLTERRGAKKSSIQMRVDRLVSIVLSGSDKADGGPKLLQELLPKESRQAACGIDSVSSRALGAPCDVHEELSIGKHGEMDSEPGAARRDKLATARAVRDECRLSRENEGGGEELADLQSGQAQGSETQEVRVDGRAVRGDAGPSEREVRDLLILGLNGPQLLSADRSLSHDAESQGPSLRELQSRNRKIQGQREDASIGDRVLEPWIIWCQLNSEQDLLAKAFGESAFSIFGSMPSEEKERQLLCWLDGERPILISKPSILGFGINAQICSSMAFVGIDDSWESLYQSIRRCWRFGQSKPVDVHLILSSAEIRVLENLKRKERDAARMRHAMAAATESARVPARSSRSFYTRPSVEVPSWLHQS